MCEYVLFLHKSLYTFSHIFVNILMSTINFVAQKCCVSFYILLLNFLNLKKSKFNFIFYYCYLFKCFIFIYYYNYYILAHTLLLFCRIFVQFFLNKYKFLYILHYIYIYTYTINV